MQGEVLLLHEGTTAGSLLYGVEFDVPGRRDELQEMIRPGGLSAGSTEEWSHPRFPSGTSSHGYPRRYGTPCNAS